jgi:hypothetical protein
MDTISLEMRPKTFDEVIGLSSVVKAIKKRIDENGTPHAIMLRGPYGTGKTTLAHIVARYVQGSFFEGQPQVTEVNGANYRKIEDMRALVEDARTCPLVGEYQVIILDEAQQLTKDAQQVLLKEFEIPSSPAVWIICTTDPEKINQGVRDRCLIFETEGMDAKARHELIVRAAEFLKDTNSVEEFEKAVNKAKLTSPRKILMAFESYHNGITAERAVMAVAFVLSPEYFDIAMGAVYGQWATEYPLFKKKFKSVAAQLKELEDGLKKKQKVAGEEEAKPDEDAVVDEDDAAAVHGKLEAAAALRNITAALLKNAILKGGDKADLASTAMEKLLRCLSWNGGDFGTEFAGTVNGLYQVNKTMRKSNV